MEKKRLIRGNHDPKPSKCWQLGWEEVYDQHSFQLDNEKVILSHYPYHNYHHTRNPEWAWSYPHDSGFFLLHGHIHSDPEQKTRGRMFDVGVDANKFTPVHINEISEWINKTKEKENGN